MSEIKRMGSLAVPPDDIKLIVDKTAQWVADAGVDFEKKLKKKRESDPNFSFLFEGNVYFAYYKQMVQFLRTGDSTGGEKTDMERAAERKIQLKKVLLGELPESEMPSMYIRKKRKKEKEIPTFERPPDDVWVIERPKITAYQDDIIKLSAQFRARNGRVFEVGLLNRESKNPQFAFLHPYHQHHPYFKKLVQSYTRCLIPERETIQVLENIVDSPDLLVDKMLNRVYYERSQNQIDEEIEDEKDRAEMAEIDWDNFLVVQTIDYEDESTMITKERKEEIKQSVPRAKPMVAAPAQREEEADELSPVPMQVDDFEVPEDVAMGNLKIRTDYKPRTGSDYRTISEKQISYITPGGKRVGVDEMNQALRPDLVDRQQLEKDRKRLSEQYESSLADNEDVFSGLNAIAEKRTDIFGDDEVEIGRRVGEEFRKKTDKPIWDGHAPHAGKAEKDKEEPKQQPKQQPKEKTTSQPLPPGMGPPGINPHQMGRTPPGMGPPGMGPPSNMPLPPGMGPPGMGPPSNMPLPPGMGPPGMGMPMPPRGGMPMPPGMQPPPGMGPPGMGMPMPMPPGMGPPGMGMIHPSMVPPGMPPIHQRPPATDEPQQKRPRIDPNTQMIHEQEWLETHPGPVIINILVPEMPEKKNWNLQGQTIRVTALMSDSIKTLKQMVGESLGGLPQNKQNLKFNKGFWKDKKSLAYYNAESGMTLELSLKSRGGKKK